jgi:hypothetical protein
MLAHHRARRAIREDWDGVLDDIEAGFNELPEPAELFPWEERKDEPDLPYQIDRHPQDGRWMTNAPPPAGFDPALVLSGSYVEGWRYAVGEEIVACEHFAAEDAEEDEADRCLTFGLDAQGRFPRPAPSPRPAASRAGSGAARGRARGHEGRSAGSE